MSNGITLGGLWNNTTKDGKPYLSGSLGNLKIFVFKNDKRGNDKAPDYTIKLVEKDRPAPAGTTPTQPKWEDPNW